MNTGIQNLSPTINQAPSALESKRPHPSEKKDEANAVLVEPKKETLEFSEIEDERKDQVRKEDLADVVAKINTAFQDERRSLQFNVDEESGRTIIKVVDTVTGEQIKQVPAEEVLEISRRLTAQLSKDDMTGMLIKSQA